MKNKMITQIYEIQTPEEAEKCLALGVDRIGSVLLSEDSRHQKPIREVIRLSEGTSAQNTLIPLFGGDNLYRALDYYRPHFVHLCENLTDRNGREVITDGFLKTQSDLKQRFPQIGIVRSIPIPLKDVSPDFPFLKIAKIFEPFTDCFLIDTWIGEEPVEGYVGITGMTCDWERARRLVLQSDIPVILAGGLSPDNVYDALLRVIPAGADSCTHTNETDVRGQTVRFRKDFKKVARFVDEVHKADNALSQKREFLRNKIIQLRAELEEREAALPAHSIRPHQLLAIEELEEEISSLEKELDEN